MNLIKIAGAVLLGLALNVQAKADNDKYSRSGRTSFGPFTHAITLTADDIHNMQALFSHSDAIHVTWNNHELKFALRDKDLPEFIIRFEAINDEPVEDWMFQPDYLSEESAGAVESWMLDTDYLNEEVQPLESWMFSESRLSEDLAGNGTESWMYDANYLSR